MLNSFSLQVSSSCELKGNEKLVWFGGDREDIVTSCCVESRGRQKSKSVEKLGKHKLSLESS